MSREWCLGDDSWHVILVLYYKMCLCAFTLQPCVMIYTVPWLPPAFCENQVVSESYFWFVMLNRYTGFCWFITTDSVILDYKETHEYKHQHLKKIFVSNISPSRLLTKPVTSLCQVIPDNPRWQSDCTLGTQNPLYAIPMEITESVVTSQNPLYYLNAIFEHAQPWWAIFISVSW